VLVEYCKQWVKTWCFDLKTKEEYDYYYNEFRKLWILIYRAKKELGHAREKKFDSYIQSSFLPKEYRMVRYRRNTVRDFDYCTLCQAEHEKEINQGARWNQTST
jgi:hypothetical protein